MERFSGMKTLIAILLGVSVVVPGPAARGQPADTAPKPPTSPERANEPAAGAESTEKFPIASFVTPVETMELLADQAQLQVVIDPRIRNGEDASGKPIPKWNEEVSFRRENMTPRQALEDFLTGYGMALVQDPDTKAYRISYKSAAAPAPTPAPQPPPATVPAPTPAQPQPPAPQPPAPQPVVATVPSAKPAEGASTETKPPADVAAMPPVRAQCTPVEAIKLLALEIPLKLIVDLRLETAVATGLDADGKPAPYLTNSISERWEGVTPRQALDSLVDKYGLVLLDNTNTHITRLAFRATKEPPITRVLQLRYAAASNVVAILKAALPSSEVTPDARTGLLVVKAAEKEFELVDMLLKKLDAMPRQVLIEAQFIETRRNPDSFKGIDWSQSLGEAGLAAQIGSGAKLGGTTTTGSGTASKPGGGTVTTPGSTVSGAPSFQFGGPLQSVVPSGVPGLFAATASGFNPNFAFLSSDGLKAVLHFLNNDSETRTLSTPRVVAMDNQETRLEVSQAIPIFDASTIVPQGGGPSVSSSKPNYTNVGTILLVTPRVVDTNVALLIKPEISKLGPVSTKTVAGNINQADTFESRKIMTQVLIPSGNTLVMGGLSSDDTSKSFNKVPLLGDIPLLGMAFRNEAKRRDKRSLVIFVTPTIVESGDFQTATPGFLKTPKPTESEIKDSMWDTGKPYDWKGGLKIFK